MLHQLKSYISDKQLFTQNDKLLVCVSGGVDSMVLLQLLCEAGYRNLGVAHCNFALRGAESDGDERLVRDVCSEKQIHFFVTRFDTDKYASEHGISIQMAARELRYAWFYQIADKERFDKIVVAHNANDEVETFFLNLSRGAGLRGLQGMAAVQGKVVRPLLWATRKQIARYAANFNVRFREDSSNANPKYARNNIRINVIPKIERDNPSFIATMRSNMEHLSAARHIIDKQLAAVKEKACMEQGNELRISINDLPAEQREFWLFELLYEYNFSADVVKQLHDSLGGQSGKVFYSDTHKCLKDRELIIVEPKQYDEVAQEITIQQHEVEHGLSLRLNDGCSLRFELREQMDDDLSCVFFDADLLQFPLMLRPWRAGDCFVPFGMKGKKKLSDFFIDSKLTLFEKQQQLLLCTANDKIVWVVGRRTDNRFRVGSKTKQVLKISIA